MGFDYDVTFMADTSLQGAGMSRVSPEMEFSDRVDIFLKKISKNIYFSKRSKGFHNIFFPEKNV